MANATSDLDKLDFTGQVEQEVPPDNFIFNFTGARVGDERVVFNCGRAWSKDAADVVTLDIHVRYPPQ